MAKQLLRVGTNKLIIKSQLNARDGFNLLFGARYEFVDLDYLPWQRVNGTWTGALGHLLNDNRLDWKQCVRVKSQLMFHEMALNSIWFRKLDNNKSFQCK